MKYSQSYTLSKFTVINIFTIILLFATSTIVLGQFKHPDSGSYLNKDRNNSFINFKNDQIPENLPTSSKPSQPNNSITVGGLVDPNYNVPVMEGRAGVFETITQPDGKIIAVGEFTKANGVIHNSIARYNSDGTLDTSFNTGGSGANNDINAVGLQADGKILIGGSFFTYNGQTANRFARLNADGSLDSSFTNLVFGNDVYDIAVQPDGKILVGGIFFGIDGDESRARIARLNSDGTIDTSFSNTNNPNNGVRKIVILSDGKILIGGQFSLVASSPRARIARLNSDGTLDTSFTTGNGVSGEIRQIIVQPSGKIVVGGFFRLYDTTDADGIARLNSDGSFDTVIPLNQPSNSSIFVLGLAVQADGKFIVGFADDNAINSTTAQVVRFNADATLDNSFTAGLTERLPTKNIEIQPDGKILISGDFLSYNSQEHIRLVRTNSDGTLDTNFNAKASTIGVVIAIAKQTDGKIIIGGDFGTVNGVKKALIARLNPDGTIDNSFDTGNRLLGSVYSIKIQTDGKIVVGGFFVGDETFGAARIMRLNSDGSLDQNLISLTSGIIFTIYAVDVQADGKILAAGNIRSSTSSGRLAAVRLNPDGTQDTSFNLHELPIGLAYSMKIQPDGKILVGGSSLMVRLNVDGTLDETFSPDVSRIRDIAPTANGKTYVGGGFEAFANNTSYRNIARLDSVGMVDSTFSIGTGANIEVRAVELQPDGKILIGGFFTDYNGNSANGLARINSDGSLDPTLNTSIGASGGILPAVFDLEFQSDGKLLVGGQFNKFNNVERSGLVRLQNVLNTGSVFCDFDGDGKTDISTFRPGPNPAQWWLLRSSDGGNNAYSFGLGSDKPVPSDFTGDGKTDLAFFRESTSEWFILRSEDSSFYSFPFGASGDIPAPGDFDGDGIADAAVYRPSSGTWFINRSSDGGTTIESFGVAEDKPTVADFDGDGKDDIAIYRPSVSQWWQLRSNDGVIAYQFGTAGDKTVQGDYTGDGKADVALFRPSSNEWFILRSEDSSFFSFPYGASGDIPTPGDYDGDGTFDAAVFRPSTTTWFLNGSTSGTQIVGFGLVDDIPLPSVYSVE